MLSEESYHRYEKDHQDGGRLRHGDEDVSGYYWALTPVVFDGICLLQVELGSKSRAGLDPMDGVIFSTSTKMLRNNVNAGGTKE